MKSTVGSRRTLTGILYAGVLGIIAIAASSCGGAASRNCLVIPAQVDLLKERREAAISVLEHKANQVDRMKNSLERAQARYEELEAEKALLDQLEKEDK